MPFPLIPHRIRLLGKPNESGKVFMPPLQSLSFYLCSIAFIWAPQLITLFVSKHADEVIHVGTGYTRIVSVFYVLLGFIVMFYGFFRGLGAIHGGTLFLFTLASVGQSYSPMILIPIFFFRLPLKSA